MAYYILKITYIIFNAYDNPVNTVMKFSRASVLSFFCCCYLFFFKCNHVQFQYEETQAFVPHPALGKKGIWTCIFVVTKLRKVSMKLSTLQPGCLLR